MIYILIHPSEDNSLLLLTDETLRELLADPVGYAGVRRFENEQFLRDNRDPNYWQEGVGVIVRAEVLFPQPVVTQWEIPK